MGCHPVVILFWNDNRMRVSSGCHFFWNVNRMGVSSDSYFFTRINQIGSIVKLKFYIKVQEEDIRVQEEFVSISPWKTRVHQNSRVIKLTFKPKTQMDTKTIVIRPKNWILNATLMTMKQISGLKLFSQSTWFKKLGMWYLLTLRVRFRSGRLRKNENVS